VLSLRRRADPLYSKASACAQQIPRATFFDMHGLDHGGAFREAGLALSHVSKFLKTATEVLQEAG
jgi:hypothetical protein